MSLSQAPGTLTPDVILVCPRFRESGCADFEARSSISHLEVCSILSVLISVFSPLGLHCTPYTGKSCQKAGLIGSVYLKGSDHMQILLLKILMDFKFCQV